MIVNNVDFEIAFTNAFGDLNRVSLSSIHDNRLRFELAGDFGGNAKQNKGSN